MFLSDYCVRSLVQTIIIAPQGNIKHLPAPSTLILVMTEPSQTSQIRDLSGDRGEISAHIRPSIHQSPILSMNYRSHCVQLE